MKRKLLILLLGIAFVAGAAYVAFVRPRSHPDNRIPEEALNELRNASELILYSLYPYEDDVMEEKSVLIAEDVPQFHGHRILGQTVLSGNGSKAAIDAVEKSVRDWDGMMATCFSPRHGIRAAVESGTYDLEICFECHQMFVHLPDGTRRHLGISTSGEKLNQILRSAKVPLPSQRWQR